MAQPIRTGPSQEYGSRVAQEEAQRAIPLAERQPAAPPAGSSLPAGGAPLVSLDAESQRPWEPVTSGLPSGPGPGPEVFDNRDPDLDQLAAYLPALEALANLPSASSATRNFVRRLRGAMVR